MKFTTRRVKAGMVAIAATTALLPLGALRNQVARQRHSFFRSSSSNRNSSTT